MRIIFILICAPIALAADSEIKYSSPLKGKLENVHLVENENYKFMASFRRENVHFCTASLLSNKHALTAATCLRDFLTEREIPDFDLYTLQAGRFDLPGKSVVLPIEEVRMHRRFRFKMPKSVYNIGIVTMLDNNVTESEYVGWGLVTTPPGMDEVKEAIVTVWVNILGTEKGNIKDDYTLKQNTVVALQKKSCGFYRQSPIICVHNVANNQSLSKEDIGAPLTEGKLIRGILAFIPDGLDEPVTFINVQDKSVELQRLMTEIKNRFKMRLPRTKARRELSKSRRVKPNHHNPYTDAVTNSIHRCILSSSEV